MKKEKSSRRKKLHKKWIYKYRLIILNEDTFEEQISFKLNRLNVFVIGSISAVFLIAVTTVLIAFTPLREYIPGYPSVKLKRETTQLMIETDSLKNELARNERYLESIRKVLTGDLQPYQVTKDSVPEGQETGTIELDFEPNKADSLLREEVANEDRFNFSGAEENTMDFVLFSPVNGSISEEFNPQEKHYAVDIVAIANAPVKAVADGRVVFAEWTSETGYVMIIEHANGLISVYKHNASLNKSQGDFVKSGEVIATVGNTGELTTGPHLHFELWNNGYPIDPTLYIDFK
ncbi:Peptidase family M23 [Pustulibacterium marinum]|uniref:Peptidase family M23 n=1 Tax=Pustulibacterium marinum TaxID=1224947 RepID=A0A1I7ETP5_9FLAO|nr:M23 family metallopeptidase [Pustulibacterium marinum]SFU27252.1 Peptidase family M23 [Pustulibacterium marinum]